MTLIFEDMKWSRKWLAVWWAILQTDKTICRCAVIGFGTGWGAAAGLGYSKL